MIVSRVELSDVNVKAMKEVYNIAGCVVLLSVLAVDKGNQLGA